TILKGANLVDGTGADPIENGTIVIKDEKIEKIGKEGSVDYSNEERVIDVTGKTIMPGMFNSHAHLAWDGEHDIQEQSENDSVPIRTFKVADNMKKSLQGGVTTVRDLGVHKSNIYAKEAAERGIVQSPRLVVSGQAIAMTGGHTWWCCREADGVDGVRKAVREQIKMGAEVIKVMGSGSVVEFTMEELEAMVDEVHRNNKKITAHATFGKAIERVTRAGFDSVEHGGTMDQETIDLLVDKDIFIVTTFSPVTLQAQKGEEFGMDPDFVERRKKQMNDTSRYKSITEASKAGVDICMGTDAGSPLVPHNEVATELQLLVEYGICEDALEAISCATGNSAKLCGVQDQRGTLKEGLLADILVIDGDPLSNLDDLRNVEKVYLGGELVLEN
ncbi:amidohydrolase family protein, partial [Candidatus Bipolaricaulota bacterium]|nr:amidohydrolase family protein [Candidatus Bipolaricaulota bacterium]